MNNLVFNLLISLGKKIRIYGILYLPLQIGLFGYMACWSIPSAILVISNPSTILTKQIST
jgi:hypothetical protein